MNVRVGFYGAGGVANYHMSHLLKFPDVKIVAVYDPVKKSRCLRVQQEFGAKPYSNAQEMLNEAKMDALYVCVPPYLHRDIEIETARRGIHLFVEKPVGLSLDKTREAEEVIRTEGVISMVGYNWRYMDITDKCREFLKDKTVGMALGYWMGGLPGVDWWHSKCKSGGQIVEQTTHVFDLARYLVGEINSVYSTAAFRLLTDVKSLNIDDLATTILRFKNGAIGCVSCTCALSNGSMVGLKLISQDLVLEISFDIPGGLDYQHSTPWLSVTTPEGQKKIKGQVNPYYVENKIFIEAVKTKNNQCIKTSYSEAVKTLAVTLAAQKSADTGDPQKVKL